MPGILLIVLSRSSAHEHANSEYKYATSVKVKSQDHYVTTSSRLKVANKACVLFQGYDVKNQSPQASLIVQTNVERIDVLSLFLVRLLPLRL